MSNYRPWGPTDLEKLQQLVELDTPIDILQEELDRSKVSISNQIEKLSKGKVKKIKKVQKKKVDLYPKTRRTQVEKAAINFLDMKVQDKDYSNVWSSILDFQEVLEEKSIEQPEAEIHINTSDWIGVAFLGDLHIGNMACNYKAMLEHRDLIAKTDNLYMALNGDYCDNFIPSSHAAGMFEALFPPAVQKNLAKDYIETIKEKVLSLVAGCFMEGSNVTMSDGTTKCIEDVEKGDKVLSGEGISRNVEKVWSSKYDDKIYKIYSEGNFKPLEVTKDHPCIVLKREKALDKDNWHINKNSFVKDNLQVIYAKDIEKGDYLASPIPQFNPENINIDLFNGFKPSIQLLRLMGYWLAEGHFKKYNDKVRNIELTFGILETDLHNEVYDICSFLGLDYTSHDRKDRNTTSIYIKSQELAGLFKQMLGEYSHSKYISKDILCLHPTHLIHIADTFALGDGCYRKNYNNREDLTITTISEELANSLVYIFDKCGITCSLRCQKRKNREYNDYQINLCEESIYYLRKTVKDPANIDYSIFRGTKQRTYDQMMWHRVSKIETEDFNGTVYDITVDGPHNLVVEKRLIHNCHDIFGLKASDWDLTEYLARHGDAVYLGPGGVLYLTVGKQKYKIMMRHKYKYNSSDNPTATVKKMFEKMGGFDVGVVSHHHLSAIEEGSKPGLDGVHKRLFIRAGTYKVHDRFGRQCGFPEGTLSVPIVLFNPKKRDIRGFQNLEEGIEYLEYLNGK